MNRSVIESIICKVGGQARLARALGHTNPTTVSGWVRRGSIPSVQIKKVIKAAEKLGIRLVAEDFFMDHLPSADPERDRAIATPMAEQFQTEPAE